MGQNRPLLFLGGAIAIALVTTFMVYQWLQDQKMTEVEVPEVVMDGVSVAVANSDLPWGTVMGE